MFLTRQVKIRDLNGEPTPGIQIMKCLQSMGRVCREIYREVQRRVHLENKLITAETIIETTANTTVTLRVTHPEGKETDSLGQDMAAEAGIAKADGIGRPRDTDDTEAEATRETPVEEPGTMCTQQLPLTT